MAGGSSAHLPQLVQIFLCIYLVFDNFDNYSTALKKGLEHLDGHMNPSPECIDRRPNVAALPPEHCCTQIGPKILPLWILGFIFVQENNEGIFIYASGQ